MWNVSLKIKSISEYIFHCKKILCVLVENADIFLISMLRPYSSEKCNEYEKKYRCGKISDGRRY